MRLAIAAENGCGRAVVDDCRCLAGGHVGDHVAVLDVGVDAAGAHGREHVAASVEHIGDAVLREESVGAVVVVAAEHGCLAFAAPISS